MFWPGTGVKHARNIEIIALFGNLVSMFLMFQACFRTEHWSMPAVETSAFFLHEYPFSEILATEPEIA
jgi:hypothetical protein